MTITTHHPHQGRRRRRGRAPELIFIGVQIGHPHSDVTAVATTEWVVRNSLKVLMAALALVGITGMYLRQVKQIGLLGLVGYLVFSRRLPHHHRAWPSSARSSCPTIAETDPAYVDDVLAAATNGSATGDIGLMQTALNFSGITFLAGGLIFGIALYRARVLARWAAALLAVASVLTVLARRPARRVLPAPGLPQLHRHDRPRLLAVGNHPGGTHRHHPGASPQSTARASATAGA